jgi:hypothetical protein
LREGALAEGDIVQVRAVEDLELVVERVERATTEDNEIHNPNEGHS